MDTGKLLKAIDDIQDEEQSAKIQTLLTNIVSYYTSPNPDALNVEKEKIRVAVTTSRLSQYALSDYKTLERLKVESLFGPGLYQRLENVLSSQAHEVATRLQQLVTERSTALSSLTTLQSSLANFHFKSRALTDHNYEIGFVLPESYVELEAVERALKDVRQFLAELAVAVGDQQALKIDYVSNGSIELFIHSHAILAQNFGTVLEYALNIYEAIDVCRKFVAGAKSFTAKRRKEIEKQAKEEKEEKVAQLIDEMIATLGITEPEAKARVSGLFKKFLQHIENGVSAEVHTPELPAPADPGAEATKEEKAEYAEAKKLYDQKKQIDEKNREVFILQQNNFYGMNTKFLNMPAEAATASSESDTE